MMNGSKWLVAVAFFAGCATTVAFTVPRARADGPAVKKWEHWCTDVDGVRDLGRSAGDGCAAMISRIFASDPTPTIGCAAMTFTAPLHR